MKAYSKEKVLLIDLVGVPALQSHTAWTTSVETCQDVVALLIEIEQNENFNEVEIIALEFNAKIEVARYYLSWEKRLGKKFVITIQDDGVDDLFVFEMTMPQ
ncbi:hypothetical protein [Paenibacillus elgii]|uniref:hypothetical protein n=1 Tax=Paenibacillus elgii TaxID=189691 RepID=UPI000248D40C|nr:hypothetical protein [Paenibacillus elgii]